MISPFTPVELVNKQNIPLGRAQRVSISYISEGIQIFPTDDAFLTLEEYLNTTDPDMFAVIEADDEGVSIRHGERPKLFGNVRGHIHLYLPRQYFGSLFVKNISGRVEATGRMVLSELTIANTSGSIHLGDVASGTAVLSSVSGSIHVASLQALATLHSTSGSIRVGSAAGDGEYKTVSGSIHVNYRDVTGDIAAQSTSGSIRLAVPPLLSFHLVASSVSGRVMAPFAGLEAGRHSVDGTVGSAPQTTIRLRTVSGRIEIGTGR